ncbi:DNA-cytosine methyltransferase [Salmonella enterica subsp. houtenae]|nr:DNA-cytosine methyltransferase [Salmonella enterica subsp. houtenae]
MQENISVTHARHLIADDAGSEIQAMLSQLLEIYDVKTLVAHLNGLGEQHWSPAILKRVMMNAAWHRLSDNELTCLKQGCRRRQRIIRITLFVLSIYSRASAVFVADLKR